SAPAPTCLSSCCWTSSTCVSERRSACRAGRGCWHAGLLAGAGQVLDVVQHVMALIDLLRVLRHLHALCIGSGVAVEVVLGLQHAVGDVQQAAAGGDKAAGCARGAGISSQLSILLVLGLRVLCQAAAQRGQRSGAQSDSQASSRDVHQTFPVVGSGLRCLLHHRSCNQQGILMPASASTSHDTERAQAGVRMIFVAAAGSYTAALHLLSLIDSGLVWKIFLLEALFCIAATLIWADVLRRPGHYRGRRLLTMFTDYSGITLALANGGAAMLPV